MAFKKSPRTPLHKLLPQCFSSLLRNSQFVVDSFPLGLSPALRYGSVLRRVSADMQRVKAKLLADSEKLKDEQTRLTALLAEARLLWTDIDHSTNRSIDHLIRSARTLQQLTIAENQITFLTAISKLRTRLSSHDSGSKLL